MELKGLTDKFPFNPKEGIDNPMMVTPDDPERVSNKPRPRLCVLRRDEGETFGFNLRAESGSSGHLVRKVVPRGVAEREDLRDGDRILEVNGRFVDDLPHPEVARRIRISGNQLCVLVLDREGYERAQVQGHDLLALVKSHEMEGCKSPRMCHVTRNHSGLGVSFSPMEGERGRFSVSLVSGGAAERAGVCQGDHLVWMNGAAVSDLTHSALARMVKKCGDDITILVVDSETEEKYLQQKMPILPAMAVPCNLPHRARSVPLSLGAQGYGFLLREEKTSSGRAVHAVREVDTGSPAQMGGLRDGELVLEVNGESVETLEHQDVVEQVKLSGPQVTLTTISAQGLDFYLKLGLSPVLFCGGGVGEGQWEQGNLLAAVAEETAEEVIASLRASLEEVEASLRASLEEVEASLRASLEEVEASQCCVLEEGVDFDGVQLTPGTSFVSQVMNQTGSTSDPVGSEDEAENSFL